MEYTASYDTSEVKIDNREFFRIDLENGYIPDGLNWGEAAVPERSIDIGVPSEYGNTIEILNSAYKELSGKIVPVGKPRIDKGILVPEYLIGENYNNYENSEDVVGFGEFEIIRGVPSSRFLIKPVKFFPLQNKIIIYEKILFRINFPPAGINTAAEEDYFSEDVVPNYNVAKYWKKETRRELKKTAASVLASGKWVKFEAPAEGMYKIDRAIFASWGFDPAAVDPRTIKIYNNGGKALAERVEEPHPYDLIENAVSVAGESDGRFDEGDYIIFYGRGIHFWEYDTLSNAVVRYFTPYSRSNYYWITAGGSNGKRIEAKNGNLNVQSEYVQNTTKAFVSWEEDLAKVAGTGRYYVGDIFTSSAQMRIYTNGLDNRVESVPVRYKFRFINASQNPFTLRVEENSNLIYSESLRGFGANQDYSAGYQFIKTVTYANPIASNTSLLKFQVSNMSSDSKGYLDNFEISYEKFLSHSGDKLLFFSKDTTAVLEYRLTNLPLPTENNKVYDVTDFANVKEITNPLMLSGGDFWFQTAETSEKVSKYIAMNTANFKTPVNAVGMENQDVKGTTAESKLIIITNKNFKDQALSLKTYRESQSVYKLPTSVVYADEIFNEFASGMGDVTAIRNFIQYAYDNWATKPEYVLLFGDGTYDAKNVEGTNNNFVPTYQIPLIKYNLGPNVTMSQLDLIDSYPMDDYFVRVDGNDPAVDLAVGRLNIQTAKEAADAVDKIINYESNMERGTWQNLITLVADDGLTTAGDDNSLHTDQSEDLARLIPKYFNINKIYLAAYPTILTGVGRTKPEVNKAIVNAINRGTLILNYIGHGSYEVWAHEFVFEKSSTISQLNNDKYFFLTAATCNFGQFDFTGTQSGAELLVLKEKSGAIGAFTSTRPVYASPNKVLNEEFYRKLLLSSRVENNLPVTVGRAYMLTKIGKTSQNDQKFHLYGDPTLRLHIPQYSAAIDSINGISVNPPVENVQLKALSKVRVNGTVKRPDNSDWTDYSGEAILSVYDSERNTRIIEVVDTSNTNVYNMNIPGGILFNGKISVINGKFAADFVVPKDISYENLNGKVVIYFYNSQTDGIGYTDRVRIGGSDSAAVNDGKGPEIDIHYDNLTSGSSSIINPDSRLIVNLSDETGVNTTGTGIGHKLEGVLNENESSPIDFTEYFTGDLDAGGKSGTINYPFAGLEQGEYKIKVKAWDVFNNFSSEESFFTVVDGNELVIRDVFNYPNPFSVNTTFTFQKNQQNGIFTVKVKVYTVAGRMIKELERVNISEDENFVKLDWDGRDEDGNLLANGVYLYKIIIKSADGQFNKSVLGKLAILR